MLVGLWVLQLSRSTPLLVILAAAIGCNDTAAPAASSYVLTAVDGRALPVTSGGTDGAVTLLSGWLILESSGQALRIVRYRDFSANGGGMTFEREQQLSGPYTITNDKITARWTSQGQCGTGPCLPNDVGSVGESTLTLTADVGGRSSPVYTYRLVSN